MNPDGFAIYCNITLSYGIFFSPFTDIAFNDAWRVLSSGDVGDYLNHVYDSYGRIKIAGRERRLHQCVVRDLVR